MPLTEHFWTVSENKENINVFTFQSDHELCMC